ncbi:MAG: GTPase domain-containing protein [Proteobacteria bacterium]|nr:GTPase domain-containing protein [Pseudomonadota bacterium]
MAELNENGRKLTVKIVYYGPAMSGKTTNLIHLHNVVNPVACGELMSIETKGDRTLFFDLLPLGVKTKNRFTILFKLFTVPGQVAHDATRKTVLSRADGVVFVADSRVSQAMNNMESFENLEKNIRRLGMDFDRLPLIIQFNKRDLTDIEPEEKILELWEQTGIPVNFATALHGRGVLESFKEILTRSYRYLNSVYWLDEKYGVVEEDFLGVLSGVR